MRLDVGRVGLARDLEPRGDRCASIDPLVASIEGIARNNGHADLVTSRSAGAVEPFAVEHEAYVGDAVASGQAGEHRLRIGHLRHAFWINEARDFEAAQARGDQPLDHLDLRRGRHDARLVLQPVARTDFEEMDFHVSHFAADSA